jgi:Flp pilus assembly protein CpaB
MDVPAARQIIRPAWLNARTVFGLLLMLIAFAGGQRILADARTTVAYWSATRDLPRGAEVGADDLAITHVQLPHDVAARYVPASEVLDGMKLDRAVAAGELMPSAWLSRAATGPGREMTIPVPPEHAVGGALGVGDTVDVYATFAPEGAEARTTLIARGIEVVGGVEAGGLVLNEEAKIGITVAVSPEEVTRLAFAIRTGELDVVRVVGTDDRAPARSIEESDV